MRKGCLTAAGLLQSIVRAGNCDRDGFVSSLDVIELISQMAPCGDCDDCPADLNGDCAVDASDLVILLGNWSLSTASR